MTPTLLPWAFLKEAERQRDLFGARLAELTDLGPAAAVFASTAKNLIGRKPLDADEWRSLRGMLDDYEHAVDCGALERAADLAAQVRRGLR